MDRHSVEPCDLLLALDIACTFRVRSGDAKKDLHEAKQLALSLVDWAVQESDSCPPGKLLNDAAEARTK